MENFTSIERRLAVKLIGQKHKHFSWYFIDVFYKFNVPQDQLSHPITTKKKKKRACILSCSDVQYMSPNIVLPLFSFSNVRVREPLEGSRLCFLVFLLCLAGSLGQVLKNLLLDMLGMSDRRIQGPWQHLLGTYALHNPSCIQASIQNERNKYKPTDMINVQLLWPTNIPTQ